MLTQYLCYPNIYIYIYILYISRTLTAQSAEAVEYTDCISAEEYNSSNECPGYDIKQSDVEPPVILELWEMRSTSSLPSLPDLP